MKMGSKIAISWTFALVAHNGEGCIGFVLALGFEMLPRLSLEMFFPYKRAAM